LVYRFPYGDAMTTREQWLDIAPQVTDAMVEAFGNAARLQVGLTPTTYERMARKTPDVVANIRANLAAVFPIIEAQVREKCALIAETLHVRPPDCSHPRDLAIAAAIRKGVS
jgi:hypothetical protein